MVYLDMPGDVFSGGPVGHFSHQWLPAAADRGIDQHVAFVVRANGLLAASTEAWTKTGIGPKPTPERFYCFSVPSLIASKSSWLFKSANKRCGPAPDAMCE